MNSILEKAYYNIFKQFQKFKIALTFDKDRKFSLQSMYEDWYIDPFGLVDNNGLPDNKYCYLSNIVIYDLISKHDIQKFYKGLRIYIKNHLSHRFLGNTLFDDRINEILNYINESNHSFDSFHKLGLFEVFDNKSNIDYYQVHIKNFSSTFFAIELNVFFTETFKEELRTIIQQDIADEKGQLINYYFHKKNKVVKRKTVSRKISSDFKYEIITRKINDEKNILFKHLNKYLKIELYNRKISPPSTNVFITNTTYDDDINSFWRSLNIDYFGYNGEFLDESCKIFYYPLIRQNSSFDFSIILNADKYKTLKNEGFNSIDYFKHTSNHICEEYFRIQILNELIKKYNLEFSKYRNKNIIGLKYKQILKLSRDFSTTFSFLQSVNKEVDWENIKINLGDKNLYKNVKNIRRFATGSSYKNSTIFRLNELIRNVELLNAKITKELEIATKNREYSRAKSENRYKYSTLFISILMLILTTLTFAVLVNNEFKDTIIELINNFKNFINELSNLIKKP